MVRVGVLILLLAALGVVCGVASLLDTFGVIDLDKPECKHIQEDDNEDV
jgi:hypothetical protein